MSALFSESFPQPATVSIGGIEVELSPLTPNDFARAEEHVKDNQRNQFLQKTRDKPLAPEVLAGTLAQIETTPVTLTDVLKSYDGQLYLVWLSSRKAMPFEHFRTKLDAVELVRLTNIVSRISGLLEEGESNGENPTTDTTKASGFQNGEKSPQTFATGTAG